MPDEVANEDAEAWPTSLGNASSHRAFQDCSEARACWPSLCSNVGVLGGCDGEGDLLAEGEASKGYREALAGLGFWRFCKSSSSPGTQDQISMRR